MGLFPTQFSPLFPFSKRGFSFPSHWLKWGAKYLSQLTGFFVLDMVKGKKRHIQEILRHPHWRAAVPGITKDIKLPRLLKIGEMTSSCTHHLFRHTQGFESMAWDSLQNETKRAARAAALTKAPGCQNRWLLTQTTNQVLLGELPPFPNKTPATGVCTNFHSCHKNLQASDNGDQKNSSKGAQLTENRGSASPAGERQREKCGNLLLHFLFLNYRKLQA